MATTASDEVTKTSCLDSDYVISDEQFASLHKKS